MSGKYHGQHWDPWTEFFDTILADPDYEICGGEWVPDPAHRDDRAYDRWIVWVRKRNK